MSLYWGMWRKGTAPSSLLQGVPAMWLETGDKDPLDTGDIQRHEELARLKKAGGTVVKE